MIFDPLWIVFMAPALLLGMWAQWKTKSNFEKYSQIGNSARMTGAEAAARMLRGQGMNVVSSSAQAKQGGDGTVAIEQGQGFLSDHYDPSAHTLRLSPDVYGGQSLSAVGVACHEAGHAMQHANGYAALKLRSALVPTASFGSSFGFIILMVGAVIQATTLIWVGIALFSAVVAFQLVTLPVEFDASARAKHALADLGIIRGRQEEEGVNKVLNAAALTYVAAAVSAISQLLYFLFIALADRR